MPISNNLDKEVILPIYSDFKQAFKFCEKESLPYLNLMGLVFHEAMYFTSCFVYEKTWYSRESKFEYPFLGYRPHKYNSLSKGFVAPKKNKAKSFFSKCLSNSGYTIAILNPCLNINKLTNMLFRERIKYIFPNGSKITIPNIDKQIEIVEKIFSHIWHKYELGDNYYQFINAIKNSYKTMNKRSSSKTKYDLLLIGSPVNMSVRSEAANALSKNIPTICIDHGNETGTADVPSWGYDEQSYCSHFIGYGSAGILAIENGTYLRSLYDNKPEYIESNCSFVKNTYNHNEIQKLGNEISNYKLAYIPMKLMGSKRLGPYLSIPDEDYLEWQRYIFKAIKNLDYKAHPKQIIDSKIDNIKIVRDTLESCINRYDCFITDNAISTVFANIAATNKPIIYFNIGFGNLTITAEKAIRERVIWIDIDINNPGSLLEKIEKQKNKKCTNNYTKQFSITDHSDSREETVLKTIKSIMS